MKGSERQSTFEQRLIERVDAERQDAAWRSRAPLDRPDAGA
ncbi:MAG: hypothetical protein ACXWUN_02930 [Allosphingosinicella sp.]